MRSAPPSPTASPAGVAPSNAAPPDRLARIVRARRAVLYGDKAPAAQGPGVEHWIENSWQRCIAAGHRPERAPSFDTIPAAAVRRTLEDNRVLIEAARPVLDKLGRAIADTRYFAILTNQHGVVVDVNGQIDRADRRAALITRIGTDLSERRLGTTAIGAALAELQPVWLHRGEHFFELNAVYSCAGAPLFGPDGACVGMLDLTGIEAVERPELKHLVAQSARSIENALTVGTGMRPHGMLLRLNWPGRILGDETDALVCVDTDGHVLGANQAARQMVPQLAVPQVHHHCDDLFAVSLGMLFDASRAAAPAAAFDVPLWSGLRLQAVALPSGGGAPAPLRLEPAAASPHPLKDIETALIRQAVDDARGNVLKAARALGVSRATVYRRLGQAVRRR
ncbi:MAG: hypothetical protein JWQ72_2777 [Polaromonas sp.]|nr:hypothetical protein [Polaromonas sp.]